MNQTSKAMNRRQAPTRGLQYSQPRSLVRVLLAVLVMAAALGGCGNKGPLKLPEDSGASGQSA